MNQIMNLEIALNKELELERQGFRRTRRWIGDADRVSDPGWYQAKASQVPGTIINLDETGSVEETNPRLQAIRTAFDRFFNLPHTRRQPVRIKA